MFWADKTVEQIEKERKEHIKSGQPLVIRDEKTMSGRVHVGSMRGVAIHGIISEILNERGIKNTFLYEIDDFSPMDGLPAYLDTKEYGRHMGKPLCTVPSPDEQTENYAEYFAQEFTKVIKETGFTPHYYRAHTLYRSGKMNDAIRIALERADAIRTIYKTVSGSTKGADWLPIHVICEQCGRVGTTKAASFDGEKVAYSCEPDMVAWASGCGHTGTISPFDGNAKLPWKVEWAAKFFVLGVHIEGAGKDHSTKGGSRDVANHIARDVFGYVPPFDIPYEFFLVEGRKMSSSRGAGSSAKDISYLIPPAIFRLALLGKNPKQTIDFVPDGDTVPTLFDRHDRIAEKYRGGVDDDDARLFSLIHTPDERENGIADRFLPRFSTVAFLAQMPHLDPMEEVAKIKGDALTDNDTQEVRLRLDYAQRWLDTYAPDDFKYELQTRSVPDAAANLDIRQKSALKEVLTYVQSVERIDGQELHTTLHNIRKNTGIAPADFFSALYLAFIGKPSGPKAGWFLSTIDKSFLEQRLAEVTK